MFITPPRGVTSQVARNAYRVYIALSGTNVCLKSEDDPRWFESVLLLFQWDSVLVLYNLHKVLERCPAELYIKPVRIPGYCGNIGNIKCSGM